MFGTKVKVEKSLYNKIKMYSDIAGYSSVEEFVHHALEKRSNSSRVLIPKRKFGRN